VPPEVYENYLKGRFALGKSKDRAEVEKSLAYFQRAIEKDPNFASAYIGLSDTYLNLSSILIGVRPEEGRLKAMEATRKALELDPQSIEAHLHMAFLHRIQWQWTEAETEVRRALELNPNNAAAQNEFAHWLAIQGRTAEGIAWVRRARELDPFEVSAAEVSWILFLSHRFPEAVQEARSAVALQPDDPGSLWQLGYALIANGQPEEAIPPMETALTVSDRSPGVIGVLIRAYAHVGRRSDALRLLAELKQRQKSGYIPSAAFVNAYLGLGETDEAFAALEQAYKEHSNILQFLKVHPHFDPIRNDPRFRDLVHRVELDLEIAVKPTPVTLRPRHEDIDDVFTHRHVPPGVLRFPKRDEDRPLLPVHMLPAEPEDVLVDHAGVLHDDDHIVLGLFCCRWESSLCLSPMMIYRPCSFKSLMRVGAWSTPHSVALPSIRRSVRKAAEV